MRTGKWSLSSLSFISQLKLRPLRREAIRCGRDKFFRIFFFCLVEHTYSVIHINIPFGSTMSVQEDGPTVIIFVSLQAQFMNSSYLYFMLK